MSPAVLAALLAKYREMARLRAHRTDDPRAALRALAAAFPGALRELDELPPATLAAREAALADAVAGRAAVPAWAEWMASYHGWLRLALRIKRTRTEVDLEAASSIAHAEHGGLHAVALADVRAMLAPPGGRLARWALRRVAREFGVPEETVAAALFVRPPRD